MVADHMENGFLENIVDMFIHDVSLYSILPELISDERLVVRIGTTALLEILLEKDAENVRHAVPALLPLLKSGEPNVRGDTVSILGQISDRDLTKEITPLLSDKNSNVRMLAEDALQELKDRIKDH